MLTRRAGTVGRGGLLSIRAILFDAYGTLFDVYSISVLAERLHPGRGAALAALWRDKQIEYSRLRTLSNHYRPFSLVTEEALAFALARLGLPTHGDGQRALLEEYGRLEPFPENQAALERLRQRGLPLAILSNGDPPMLERVVAHARLTGMFSHILSADAVGRFKTAPEVYQLGVDAFGVPARELLFVSSNGWDACGATWFGFTTFWINRTGQPPEQLGVSPNRTGRSMQELVDFVESMVSS